MKIENLEVYVIVYKIENNISGKIYIGITAKKASEKYGIERGTLSGGVRSKKPKTCEVLNGEKLT